MLACSCSEASSLGDRGDSGSPGIGSADGRASLDPSSPTSLRPWPPASSSCDLALRGSDIHAYEDTIPVCPGAYGICPPGYGAGDTYQGYAAILSFPANWTPTTTEGHLDRISRNGMPDEKDFGLIQLMHWIGASREEALRRLEGQSAAHPTAYFERLEIQGRPAQRFSYRREKPLPGSAPAPRYREQWVFGLDVLDDDVFVSLWAATTTEADPGVFCEIEAILSSLRFKQ
jgi:hypothetical protein